MKQEEEPLKLFHQHVLIKAFVKNPPMTESHLEQWFTELVSLIGMKICIAPRAKYVDTLGNEGVTGVCGIETSHLSLHCWSEITPAKIEMDCYSCSKFEVQTILNKLSEFELVKYEYMLIDRNDEFKVIAHVST